MALTSEQRVARSKGIGGSDAPVVAGLSLRKTRVQLWQEKRGEVPEPNLDDDEFVMWGRLLEDTIADEAGRRRGWRLQRVRRTIVDREYPFMLANIDRRIVGLREGLEIKNASEWLQNQYGEEDSDDLPLPYLMQGVHYMRVLDYQAWNWAVFFGGHRLRFYRAERDLELEDQLISVERDFWHTNVIGGVAPAPMKIEDLNRLYKTTHGVIQATEEIAEMVAECAALAKKRKQIVTREEELKLAIGTFMGDKGDLLDHTEGKDTIATYRAHGETRVDAKAVKDRLKPALMDLCHKLTFNPPNGFDYEAEIDKIVASTLKKSTVRKFLAKGTT